MIMDKGRTEKEVDLLVLPTDILKGLHDELRRFVGDNILQQILFASGYRAGLELVKRLGIKSTADTLAHDLEEFAISAGIGEIKVKFEGKLLVIETKNSQEARAIDESNTTACNLTTGYLSGVVSGLLDIEYKGREVRCICVGDESCIFHLKRVVGRVALK